MKNFGNIKGITLIALIVTIIVMLILVTVTIALTVNGGLFGYAKNAATETNREIEGEMNKAEGKVSVGNIEYSSMDEYIAKKRLIEFKVVVNIQDFVNNTNSSITINYTAKRNSTWKDFIVSEYNNDEEWKINYDDLGLGVFITETGDTSRMEPISILGNQDVKADELIEENGEYYTTVCIGNQFDAEELR